MVRNYKQSSRLPQLLSCLFPGVSSQGFSRVTPEGGTARWGVLTCPTWCLLVCTLHLLAQEAEGLTQGPPAQSPDLSASLGSHLDAPPVIWSSAYLIFLSSGSPPTKRQRRSRGRPSGGARRRRRGATTTPQQQQEPARPTSEGKVTCGRCWCVPRGVHVQCRAGGGWSTPPSDTQGVGSGSGTCSAQQNSCPFCSHLGGLPPTHSWRIMLCVAFSRRPFLTIPYLHFHFLLEEPSRAWEVGLGRPQGRWELDFILEVKSFQGSFSFSVAVRWTLIPSRKSVNELEFAQCLEHCWTGTCPARYLGNTGNIGEAGTWVEWLQV